MWVSYEPWGWAPYHYGRWAHVGRLGWCWVPPTRGAAYWAPAYVGWVNTPTYVAWVPLAPMETYYGRGYFGPHSVDIMRGNTDGRRPVYRNVHVNDAVTTVNITTFLSGRPTLSRVKDNLFLNHQPSLGAPSVAPVRASMMPVVKEIPRGKEPPDRFRQVHRTVRSRGWRGPAGAGAAEPGYCRTRVGQRYNGRLPGSTPGRTVWLATTPLNGQSRGLTAGLGPDSGRQTAKPTTTGSAVAPLPERNRTVTSTGREGEQWRGSQEKDSSGANRRVKTGTTVVRVTPGSKGQRDSTAGPQFEGR